MRLPRQAQQIIRDAVREVLGDEASVKVFGSRINDATRGGDIDLLVELPSAIAEIEHKTMRLTVKLQLHIGDQRIDVLVLDPSMPGQPIHEHGSATGVRL